MQSISGRTPAGASAAGGHFSATGLPLRLAMKGLQHVVRGLGVLILITFLIIAGTPVTSGISRQLAVPEDIRPSDAIVVLGAGVVRAGMLREESMRRMSRGLELYKQGLAPLLIVLGSGSEIETRAKLALALGVPSSAIVRLETRTTTREEAERTAVLLRQQLGHRIILVTESLHMHRAKMLFERAGLEVSPAVSSDYSAGLTQPGDRLWLAMRVSQEFVALIYYRIAGYI